jgi:sugar lactone lactonase YvrE
MPVRTRVLIAGATLAAALVVVPSAAEAGGRHRRPDVIPLPLGFQPEGIARDGRSLYAGSLRDGDIYRADLTTGKGSVLVDAPAGRIAVGMTTDDRHRLFVAGGAGTAYVYDDRTGAPLADYRLGDPATAFVNDVTLTRTAAWFTDSFRPVLYQLPLGRRGQLPPTGSAAAELAITGPAADDQVQGFNHNGIVSSPDGRHLVVVNSTTGGLYRIDAGTGTSVRLDLGGATLVNGDGLVLEGRRLYVVLNTQNRIAVVDLDRGFTSGRVVASITDDDFRVPTTAVAAGDDLYAVNARFDVAPPGTPADPTLEYEIVRVDARPGKG